LASYGGAMIVVSHDRYLLRRLAEKVLWIRDGRASLIDGGYERFEELQRRGDAPPAPQKPKPKPVVATPVAAVPDRDERRRRERTERDLAAAEREVARLDGERARLEREFADPAIYGDRERVATLERELEDVRRAVDAAYATWERLSERTAVVGG
jgi:ATP-binding cassette subfamily F protein 3